jgi:hypothetical protein
MSQKIVKLGITRDPDLMYYIKGGDVWASPRKQPGKPKGKPQKIASTGIELDYSKYLYFVDGDGDVARKERASGGSRSKAPKASKAPRASASAVPMAPIASKPSKSRTASKPESAMAALSKRTGKTEAELDREIEECLGQKSGVGTTASARKKRR